MVLINELIGSFGKYHLQLCFIVFLSKFGAAFHQMAIIFLAPPPQYHCPGSNATCCDDPVYDTSVFTRTIVTEWNLICQKVWLKILTQIIFQFGVLCGSLLLGIASDKYGRKPAMIVAVILEVFAGVMCSFLPDFWSFTIVRMLVGFAVGGIVVISYVIIMEYVGHSNRDLVSSLFHVPFTVGYVMLAAFGYFIRDYSYFQLSISVCNVVLLSYICLLPESPRWLLAVNRNVEAVELMERVAKVNKLPTQNISEQMALYQMEHRNTAKSSVVDLFRTRYMRTNIIVMSFTWLVCSYCYYGLTYYISHLTGDVYINVAASGGVCVGACFISIPLMKFCKRKTVTIIGNASCSLCLCVLAFVPEGKISVVFGCLGVLCSYVVFIVIYLHCSEMFPTVVRNTALGICSMMARVGSMIAPFVADFRPYGQWCAPVAFGIFPLIAAVLTLLLPETRDSELLMTVEEGEEFNRRLHRNSSNANRNNIT